MDSLFNVMAVDLYIKNNAFQEISKHLTESSENVITELPPGYFKLGKVKYVDVESKTIHNDMYKNLPVGNCGDGVSVNGKVARLLAELYGMFCSDFKCSAHVVDGTLKRLAQSETMCVDQVKSLYEALRSVVKHFQSSVKSKEKLDEAMQMLEMRKGVHLISWCATRMAHFLTTCSKFDELLVPAYNTTFTSNLKREERNKLFTSENMKVCV